MEYVSKYYNLSLGTILFTSHSFYARSIPYYVSINFQHKKFFLTFLSIYDVFEPIFTLPNRHG